MVHPVSDTSAPTQLSKREQREAYFQALLNTVQAQVPDELSYSELRGRARAIVKEHTFPSAKDEDWRFTDLSAMLSIPFTAAQSPAEIDLGSLGPVQMPEAIARIVFVNGQFNETLSDVGRLPVGVVVGSLAALQTGTVGEKLAARLARSNGSNEAFTALNTAGFQDAAVIWVPRNQEVEQPVQVVYLSVGRAEPVITSPRCLVVAETGSQLTLVEDFYGAQDRDHFNNSVSEIWVDDNAQVSHVRLQREGTGTFHIGKTVVTQDRDSRYTLIPITLGARLSRHHLEVYQSGPQTDTNLYGLTAIANTQLADTHSLIAMSHPHGTAEQIHKCIVDDAAHSVFNGKVWVSREAQLTNASQLNRNLLLSNKARVDTKPELDIVADNVKCAHGATVSQLDDNEVFYLQSRGIDAEAAQRMLISGFALDITSRIPIPSLEQMLSEKVIQQARL
ncbi:Fe-S cluster assembly protein SufD [Oscillatoria sp. CS-180]|uniref:Fe-S cluster assembly protein SufD n=1 Tax=Oscillatoria sp. CS-180 TaxID=3021720 RepID=UPI0023310ACC|nr:Fe-S cluster assembly protein SufD [Oscillatoria sp. CS-180]MDB9528718.1 Fe-S cluster assembly protein SufD [Oscillatoria sp. CS-180]